MTFQAECFTLIYYTLDRPAKPDANGFRIMEVSRTVGVFGIDLRTKRRQIAWHRNFYAAQDAVKVLNKKACRFVWHGQTACLAAKGLDL